MLPAFISTVPSPVTSIIFIAFSELISPTIPADATILVADIEPVSKLSEKVENVPVVSFQPNLTFGSVPLLISIPTSSDAAPVWSPFNNMNGSATLTVSEFTVVVEP